MSMKSTIEQFADHASKMQAFHEGINDKPNAGYYRGKAEAYTDIAEIMTSLGITSFINPPKEYYSILKKAT